MNTEYANDRQEGGDHYRKRPTQPWDYIAANDLDFFEGSIVKYVTRWEDKGGVEDLKKARHYLDKLIELKSPQLGPVVESRPLVTLDAEELERLIAPQRPVQHLLQYLHDAIDRSRA